jgi:hypothetical protein
MILLLLLLLYIYDLFLISVVELFNYLCIYQEKKKRKKKKRRQKRIRREKKVSSHRRQWKYPISPSPTIVIPAPLFIGACCLGGCGRFCTKRPKNLNFKFLFDFFGLHLMFGNRFIEGWKFSGLERL